MTLDWMLNSESIRSRRPFFRGAADWPSDTGSVDWPEVNGFLSVKGPQSTGHAAD
jgi:hypothetical protein